MLFRTPSSASSKHLLAVGEGDTLDLTDALKLYPASRGSWILLGFGHQWYFISPRFGLRWCCRRLLGGWLDLLAGVEYLSLGARAMA